MDVMKMYSKLVLEMVISRVSGVVTLSAPSMPYSLLLLLSHAIPVVLGCT